MSYDDAGQGLISLPTRLLRPACPPAGYEATASKLVAALREAISTDLSDADEFAVRSLAARGRPYARRRRRCRSGRAHAPPCLPGLFAMPGLVHPPSRRLLILLASPSRQVRRAADPAKGLVREFLSRWRGAGPAVEGSESYRQLNAAIQQLAAFYQVRAGWLGGWVEKWAGARGGAKEGREEPARRSLCSPPPAWHLLPRLPCRPTASARG